ncbi:MAG: NAD(P)/FAD-dependent oxidoreductase [Candidatus Bilamarchaeaceae archaeon]
MYDVAIIGGGVAGLSAAMYSGRLRLKTILLTELRGGALATAGEIRNWPGVLRIDGAELAKQLEAHAREYNIEIKDTVVTTIKKSKGGFEIETPSAKYESRSIILATGTSVRKLGIPGEEEFANKGVHYCALCDGYFYTDKTIAVVGGSDSAAKEALILTQWANKVYIIYRKEKLRAEPVTMEQLEKNRKITVIPNTNIVEIKGDEKGVKAVILDKPYNGSKEFPVDAVFVEIGRVAASGLAKALGVKLNESGEVMVDREGKTNVDGVFAAGDVTDTKFKQAILAAASGVAAAFCAYDYLKKLS